MPLGTEVGLSSGPGNIVLDGDLAPPTEISIIAPTPLFGSCLFRPVSIVVKRSPISATAEFLFLFIFRYFRVFGILCLSIFWLFLWPLNRAGHYILQLWFLLFSSPILSGRRLDVCHTSHMMWP